VAFDDLHLHAFLAPELARTGVLAGLASVEGGESYWHARADGEDRMAMLETEFLPLPRAGVRARPGGQRDRRLVDGLLRRPPRRRARSGQVVGSRRCEPPIWPDYGDLWVGDAFDSQADFEQNDVFAGAARLKRMPVWIGCGTSDPFYANARGLAAALRGAPHRLGRRRPRPVAVAAGRACGDGGRRRRVSGLSRAVTRR
jgi:hypothetical protein